MSGGFDRLASPAGLLADGLIKGDTAVREGDCADYDGDGVEAARQSAYGDCPSEELTGKTVQGIRVLLLKRSSHLGH